MKGKKFNRGGGGGKPFHGGRELIDQADKRMGVKYQ